MLMDSGAIYTWTQNDQVIIRYNYIHDYTGASDNRGMFCDDGAANFKIIGNRILRIANSYCVDSRIIKDQRPEKFMNKVLRTMSLTGVSVLKGETGKVTGVSMAEIPSGRLMGPRNR